MSDLLNPVAVPGHNQPPEPTPYETAAKRILDLYEESKLWMDGAAVDTAELADGIANLKVELAKARKAADTARAAEKKPHDDAGAAVQALYKPLLAKADLAISACNTAVEPYLRRMAAEKAQKAETERLAAMEKARLAQEAIRAADHANLAEREAAEQLLVEAKRADKAASAAERETNTIGGAVGRRIGLRTYYVADMTDPVVAARHYWKAEPERMRQFIQALADEEVRAGKRDIPGFNIREEKRVA